MRPWEAYAAGDPRADPNNWNIQDQYQGPPVEGWGTDGYGTPQVYNYDAAEAYSTYTPSGSLPSDGSGTLSIPVWEPDITGGVVYDAQFQAPLVTTNAGYDATGYG